VDASSRLVTCPECGATVKESNLRRHLSRVHSKQLERSGPKRKKHKSIVRKLRRHSRYLFLGALIVIFGLGLLYAVNHGLWRASTGGQSTMSASNLPRAIFETNLGSFVVELDTRNAPITAGNFMDLAASGFYNGLTFHRIVKGALIQGGDPYGNGTGGSGKNIPWENTTLRNLKYTIAMARAGDPNDPRFSGTASSQFFINLKDNTYLDNFKYPFVVFGRVVEGFDVVDSIGSLAPPGSATYDGPPTMTVKMNVSIHS